MHTRQLGKTGLTVSCIGLGAMPMSVPAKRPTEADAIGVIHHAIDCGVTFIDTAAYVQHQQILAALPHNAKCFSVTDIHREISNSRFLR